MKKPLLNALNKQIAAEFYSSYLYLSMSAYLESINLKGFAHWMNSQAQEEIVHGMKIYNYVPKKELKEIPKQPNEWKSVLDVFQTALKHEKKVTRMINSLVTLAKKHKDKETQKFLKWFVDEQVEEEESATEVVNQIKEAKSLLKLDKQMKKRKLIFKKVKA